MSNKHDDDGGYPRDCYPTRASRTAHLNALAKVVEGVRDGKPVVIARPPVPNGAPVVLPSGALLQRPTALPPAHVVGDVRASVRLFLSGQEVGAFEQLQQDAEPHGVYDSRPIDTTHDLVCGICGNRVFPCVMHPFASRTVQLPTRPKRWPPLAATRREFIDRLAASDAVRTTRFYRPAERWPEDPRMLSRDELVRRALRARR